jgi:Cupin-like domain
MPSNVSSVRELRASDAAQWLDELGGTAEPLLVRGLVRDWPLVQAALRSSREALAYLRGFYQNATVGAWFGAPQIRGRFFYNEDFTGFNFEARFVKLDAVFDEIERVEGEVLPPSVYVGSTTIDTCLPGLRARNDVAGFPSDALASIWVGNRTRIAAHFDMPDNLACVAVGRRRFTLFPPTELANLYLGPLDLTPAGQQISLVDVVEPDLERHPRFALALRSARVAELEAGDALYIPGMWWHHVEALATCNVLVNYWWQQTPAYAGPPVNALMHALLSVRALPVGQRAVWREFFERYVFAADDEAVAHLPPERRGVLGTIDESRARTLRAFLLRQLNR